VPTVRTLKAAGLLALLALGTGCSLYLPRPVTFRVRDRDTGQPVPGARVEANYLTMMDFGSLVASVGPRQGVTDGGGDLALVLDPRHRAFRTRVSADGYPEDPVRGSSWFGSPRWQRHVPGPRLGVGDEYLIHLFRGPQPTAEVTVPDGYRGVVAVRFGGCDRPPPALRGRREFAYAVTAGGVVDIPQGGLFENLAAYDGIRVRYGDGPTLPTIGLHGPRPSPPDATAPADPADAAVALRFITPDWERHIWLYVLGTAAEAEAVNRAVWPDDNHFDEAAFERIVGAR
jgi:hypothetical protein